MFLQLFVLDFVHSGLTAFALVASCLTSAVSFKPHWHICSAAVSCQLMCNYMHAGSQHCHYHLTILTVSLLINSCQCRWLVSSPSTTTTSFLCAKFFLFLTYIFYLFVHDTVCVDYWGIFSPKRILLTVRLL